jgi:3-phytase
MNKTPPTLFLAALFLAACNAASVPVTAPDPAGSGARVEPIGLTAPVTHGSLVNVAFWQVPGAAERLVIGAAGITGLQVYRPDGTRLAHLETVDTGLVTTIPGMAIAGEQTTLIVVYDAGAATLAAYTFDPASGRFLPAMPDPVPVGDEVTGLCQYRSRLSGTDYVYAVTDAGLIHHYELYGAADGVAARLLRTIPSGKGSGFCADDPRDGALYVAEESTGVWRIGAEAEADTTREPVDLRAPFGGLSDDIKGVAVYPATADLAYLLVADLGNEHIAVYTLPDGEPAGTFAIEGLSEPEGLALSTGDGSALLAIADEDPADGGSDIKLVDFTALASTLGLQKPSGLTAAEIPVVVRPTRETDVIPTWGDSADDPAIWVHPDDATQSLVIGTGKKSGLYVFDLEGRTLQVLEDGRMNNVDVRDGFPLGGETVAIVAASNRSNDGIAVYRIDAENRKLIDVADGVLPTGFADPYGLCLYHSGQSGEFFVFVNDSGTGLVRQWRLSYNGSGRVAAEAVRDLPVGSQAEGCVADDQNGTLYVAEEDIGLWKYSAEPGDGDERTSIDSTDESGRLTDDVEGIALYDSGNGKGYLVVSNQGANNYALYRREGDNAFVGFFHIVANAAEGIDGASETDGLDVSSAGLGDAFPDGLLVVQDGRNIAPEERQNFKYVSWSDVARALDLD